MAAALLALAACGSDGPRTIDSSTPPETRALEGCASGRTATFLHQNRPGGSDFNATRCAGEGY